MILNNYYDYSQHKQYSHLNYLSQSFDIFNHYTTSSIICITLVVQVYDCFNSSIWSISTTIFILRYGVNNLCSTFLYMEPYNNPFCSLQISLICFEDKLWYSLRSFFFIAHPPRVFFLLSQKKKPSPGWTTCYLKCPTDNTKRTLHVVSESLFSLLSDKKCSAASRDAAHTVQTERREKTETKFR